MEPEVTLILAIVLVLCFLIFIKHLIRVRSNKEKGEKGERKVAKILGKDIKNKKYVFNNYYTTLNDRSCQIDHILVNDSGVFVIETKNYSGRIVGYERQQEWVQIMGKGKVQNIIRNPIKQNLSHIYAIKKYIPNTVPIYSLVVFVQNNTSEIYAPGVVSINNLDEEISRKPSLISSNQIVAIAKKLEKHNMQDKISNRQHVKNIKKMQRDLKHNICPRCGGKLVVRHGKNGDFLGCENYPKCRFTKNL